MKKLLICIFFCAVILALGLAASDVVRKSDTGKSSTSVAQAPLTRLFPDSQSLKQTIDPWGIERRQIEGSKIEPLFPDKGPVRLDPYAELKARILRIEAELEEALRNGGELTALRGQLSELHSQLPATSISQAPLPSAKSGVSASNVTNEAASSWTEHSLSSTDPLRMGTDEEASVMAKANPVEQEIKYLLRRYRDVSLDDPIRSTLRERLKELGVSWGDVPESGREFSERRPLSGTFTTAVSSPDVPEAKPAPQPIESFSAPLLNADPSSASAFPPHGDFLSTPEDLLQRQINELLEQHKTVGFAGGDVSMLDAQLETLIAQRQRTSLDNNGGVTFYSSHDALAIPDAGCVEGTINVTGIGSTIVDVEVQIDSITHPNDQQLDIYLISPAGDTCELSTDNGGNNDHYIGTRFDDDAATSITAGTAPYTGSFRPEEALSTFDGENPNGTWKLRVCDDTALFTGFLRRWRIQILSTTHGDSCLDAIDLTVPNAVAGYTCGARDNYYFACPFAVPGGKDVVYRYTPSVTQNVTFSLCRSDYDTKLMIYDGTCAGTPIACNDDAGYCPGALGSFRSLIECQTLTAGHTYYIVVDGYGLGDCGDYWLEAGICATCQVTTDGSEYIECSETPDTSNVSTDCNGGLNNFAAGGTATYDTLICGQAYLGRGFTYRSRYGTTRDTDFYRFRLEQADSVRITVFAEFNVYSLLRDSLYTIYANGSATACDTLRYTSPLLPAGVYQLGVMPDFYTGVPIPADYRVMFECFANTPGSNCGSAIEFAGIQTLGAQTNCGLRNDYSNTCLNSYDMGEDILYRWIVTEANNYYVWLNPRQTQWTGILLDDDCPPATSMCIGSSTSTGDTPHGISCVSLEPDTYYIMVDTWPSPDCIPSFDLMTGYCYPHCVAVQPEDIMECTETADTSHTRLDCNGGCNNVQAGGVRSWAAISSGQTIFGRGFTYASSYGHWYRDTDFYVFTLTERDCVTIVAKADFPLSLGIIDTTTCMGSGYFISSNERCDTLFARFILEAGTYALFVGPTVFTGIPVPQNYRVYFAAAPWTVSEGTDCSQPELVENSAILWDQSTCLAANDYTSTCLSVHDNAEDRLYRWHVTEAGEWKIWMDPHGAYYTGLALDEACPPDPSSCLGISESLDDLPHGIQSVVLDTGSYYVMADNMPNVHWCIPQYDLYFQRNCIACQPGDVAECTEYMDTTHAYSDCNGGCRNLTYDGTPAFGSISNGVTVCGSLFQYWYREQRLTDTDYYLFTVTQVETIRVNVRTDIPVDVVVVDTNGCYGEAVIDWLGLYSTCDSATMVIPCINPGTYALIITGAWDNVFAPGRYRITLESSATACPLRSGRDCAHTINVTSGITLRSHSTCPMQADYDNTCLGGFDGGADIVYQWVIDTAGYYYVWLDPYESYYTGILLDDECPPNSDNCIARSWNYNTGAHWTPCTYLDIGTYYVMVDSWPWPYCIPRFDVSFASCDTCIVCGTDVIIECLEYADSTNASSDCNGGCNNATNGGINQFASIENGQTVCGRGFTSVYRNNPYRDTDWFTFTLSQSETVRVTAFAEFPAMVAIVDTNEVCSDAYIISAIFPGVCDTTELVIDSLGAGSYFLWVGPSVFDGIPLPRNYKVTLNTIPHRTGNDCTAPLAAMDADSFMGLTTCGMLNDYSATCMGEWDGGQDLIVEWTITQAGSYSITLNPQGTLWTAMSLSASCPPGMNCISASYMQGYGIHSIACVNLSAGTYYLMVDTWPGPDCIPTFDLTFHPQTPPANDACVNAAPLSVPSTVYSSTVCASRNLVYNGCVDTLDTYGVWYSIVGNGNEMTASLCSTAAEWDAKLSLYSCNCEHLHCVVTSDDDCGRLPEINWCSRIGETYLLLVHGWGNYRGDFRLDVTDDGTPCIFGERCPCWHNTVWAPEQLAGSSEGAISSCSWLPYPDQVFRVRIPSAGYWNFSLCGSSFDTYLMLGTDCCLHDIATADNFYCNGEYSLQSEVCVYLPAAGYYYATIEGTDSDEDGPFILNVQPSDGFVPAQVTGVNATENLCATVQVSWNDVTGEDGYTIWSSGGYAWHASADSTHSVDYWINPGSVHAYTVTAVTACGESPPSLADSGMAWDEVSQVTGVAATDSSCLNIFISWYDVALEDGFHIYRNGALVGTTGTDVVSFMDTPGIGTFGYTVRGFNNACGDGPLSATDTGTVYSMPTTVGNLSASTWDCYRVALTWTDGLYETIYRIQRDGVPISGDLPAGTEFYADSTATPDVQHRYGVLSINLCGTIQSETFGRRLPVPPHVTNVIASDTLCNGVSVTWTDVAGETYYELHRNGSILANPLPENSTSYLDTTAVAGIIYGYSVCAHNIGCIGPCSIPDSGRRRTPPLQAPVPNLPDSCQPYHICWTAVTDAESYRIWRDQTLLGTVQAPTLCINLTAAPQPFSVQISAVNVCGEGPRSAPIEIGFPVLPQIAGFTATDGLCDRVTMSWTVSGGAAEEYRIYRDNVLIDTCDTLFYADSTAIPYVVYAYSVEGHNDCGTGARCVPENGMCESLPVQVLGLAATQNRCDSVIVTWTDLNYEIGYRVYRDGEIFVVGPNTTRFADAPPAGSHVYSVRATSICGDGPMSDSTTGIRLTAPGVPSFITASDDQCGSVLIWWGEATGDVDEIRFYRDGVSIGSTSPDAESYIDSPVAGAHAYTAAAYSTECGVGMQCTPDSGNGRQPPAEVSDLQFTSPPVCDSIRLTWDAAAGDVDGYAVMRDGALIDSTAVLHYTDYSVDDRYDHPYTVMAYNAYCGVGPTATPVMGSELPLTDMITAIPDTIPSGRWFIMDLRVCPNVDSCRFFLSLNHGFYEHLRTIIPAAMESLYFEPVAENIPMCRLRFYVHRDLRIDTMETVSFVIGAASAVIDPLSGIPADFFIDQNYPNPFNPATTIRFGVPHTSEVTIEVFDVLGRRTDVLVSGVLQPGVHTVVWDCIGCPTGMYLIRMQADSRIFLKKVLLMK